MFSLTTEDVVSLGAKGKVGEVELSPEIENAKFFLCCSSF